jgi:hypothetical protein
MFALLGVLFPFVKGFLGEGLVQKYLQHKEVLAASANEMAKAGIDADIRMANFELQRRQAQRDLQLKEMEHPFLWWPKMLIMMAVALYVFARFSIKIFGLDDFHIVVKELDPWEMGIVYPVMAYLFLGNELKRYLGK